MFLNENAKDTVNECFPENDVDIFTGNTQKKGKTTRVKEDGTTPVNVATNVVFLQSNPPTNHHLNNRKYWYCTKINWVTRTR